MIQCGSMHNCLLFFLSVVLPYNMSYPCFEVVTYSVTIHIKVAAKFCDLHTEPCISGCKICGAICSVILVYKGNTDTTDNF